MAGKYQDNCRISTEGLLALLEALQNMDSAAVKAERAAQKQRSEVEIRLEAAFGAPVVANDVNFEVMA